MSKIKFFYVRVVSVVFDFFLGFAQAFIFLRVFHTNNSAYLLWIFGISTYLMFFDFGFTKVSYAKIRDHHLNNKDYQSEVYKTLSFLSYVWAILLGLFTVLVFWMSSVRGTSLSITELMLVSLIIPLNILFVFLRQIYSAIDKFKKFEYLDIIRKLINLAGYSVLLITHSLKFGFLITVVGMSLIGIYMITYLLTSHTNRFSNSYIVSKFDFKQIKTSQLVLIFTIAETFIYNGGFIFLPLLNSDNTSIIYYSLWIKIFTGMAVFMRTINDSYIPEQTRAYFTNNLNEAKRLLEKSFKLSFIFCLVASVGFLFFNKIFMFYWTNNKYHFDYITLAAIFIMLVGNSMQHVSGSFLMDVGANYTFMRNSSLLILALLTLTFIVSFKIYNSISLTIFSTSIVYFIGSFLYFNKAKRVVQ